MLQDSTPLRIVVKLELNCSTAERVCMCSACSIFRSLPLRYGDTLFCTFACFYFIFFKKVVCLERRGQFKVKERQRRDLFYRALGSRSRAGDEPPVAALWISWRLMEPAGTPQPTELTRMGFCDTVLPFLSSLSSPHRQGNKL